MIDTSSRVEPQKRSDDEINSLREANKHLGDSLVGNMEMYIAHLQLVKDLTTDLINKYHAIDTEESVQ